MTENQNKAEAYLKQIRDVERTIKNKRDELDALRYKASGATAIRYDKDKVQTSPQDYLTMAIMDIIEIEKQLEEDAVSIEEMKGSAYAIVRQMQSADQRALIEWFYLNGISMTETADRMNMSERTAYYLRNDALEGFGKLM